MRLHWSAIQTLSIRTSFFRVGKDELPKQRAGETANGRMGEWAKQRSIETD